MSSTDGGARELTPMMQQYMLIHEQVPDCILFFRLGDFYEMFADDARVAARELDLTLTTRDHANPDLESQIPMCGVPFHAYESYLSRLVTKGYKVAICEQTEDPSKAKGLVKREIVRVVTPGSVTESAMLDEGRNNYMACVYCAQQRWGLAFCDISTGAFFVTSAVQSDAQQRVICELGQFSPVEVLLGGEASGCEALQQALQQRLQCCVQDALPDLFDVSANEAVLLTQFGVGCLQELGLSAEPEAVSAAGALLQRLQGLQKSPLPHIRQLKRYLAGEYMQLDLATRRNLELTETLRSREKKGTLLWVLDRTKTAMGGRLLRSWLEKPLLNVPQITRRLGAVEELFQKTVDREELIRLLADVCDLERVLARAATGAANARDMRSLAVGASALPGIKTILSTMSGTLLSMLSQNFDALEDICDHLHRAIVDDPPVSVRDGGMIRPGFSAELDEYHSLLENGKQALSDVEAAEREKTGIRNLRVRYNRVFGYSIEVPKSYTGPIPEGYIRRQTLTNAERYITVELKDLEDRILNARERVTVLEGELFSGLKDYLVAAAERIQATAATVAQIDVLCSLADVAVKNGYTMPEVDLSGQIEIQEGRHPVVERMQNDGLFVANSTRLGMAGDRAAIITGPNMAGKSTYMRQVALIVLMAQIGSFVPAKRARIGLTDRIFTRIGASDDLAAGRSTFMVEMAEVADILRYATQDSLLIFDEIGRGTSTFDGMAIARAVLEYVSDPRRLGAKTLFATHYHELTVLADELQDVKNYNIAVRRRDGQIVFLRRIVPGPADESLGVEVARLAGLPDRVITRARSILKSLEAGEAVKPAGTKKPVAAPDNQLSLSQLSNDKIRQRLENLTLETMTPLEAMAELSRLKQLL